MFILTIGTPDVPPYHHTRCSGQKHKANARALIISRPVWTTFCQSFFRINIFKVAPQNLLISQSSKNRSSFKVALAPQWPTYEHDGDEAELVDGEVGAGEGVAERGEYDEEENAAA